MAGGVYADIRPHETVVANGYGSLVKYREVEIGEEAAPHMYMSAIVAVEGLVDECVLVACAEYPPQHVVTFLEHCRANLVVLPTEVLTGIEVMEERRVGGIIYLSADHFLVFCLLLIHIFSSV